MLNDKDGLRKERLVGDLLVAVGLLTKPVWKSKEKTAAQVSPV